MYWGHSISQDHWLIPGQDEHSWICSTKYSQSYACENHLLCVLHSLFLSHLEYSYRGSFALWYISVTCCCFWRSFVMFVFCCTFSIDISLYLYILTKDGFQNLLHLFNCVVYVQCTIYFSGEKSLLLHCPSLLKCNNLFSIYSLDFIRDIYTVSKWNLGLHLFFTEKDRG